MRGIKLGEVGIWDPLNMFERDRRHVVYNGCGVLRYFRRNMPRYAATLIQLLLAKCTVVSLNSAKCVCIARRHKYMLYAPVSVCLSVTNLHGSHDATMHESVFYTRLVRKMRFSTNESKPPRIVHFGDDFRHEDIPS